MSYCPIGDGGGQVSPSEDSQVHQGVYSNREGEHIGLRNVDDVEKAMDVDEGGSLDGTLGHDGDSMDVDKDIGDMDGSSGQDGQLPKASEGAAASCMLGGIPPSKENDHQNSDQSSAHKRMILMHNAKAKKNDGPPPLNPKPKPKPEPRLKTKPQARPNLMK